MSGSKTSLYALTSIRAFCFYFLCVTILNMNNTKIHPIVFLGIILGGSFLIATILGAFTVFKIRAQNDVVTVTGSAKIEVTSDLAKWNAEFSRTVRESALSTGYSRMANDLIQVKSFLTSQGITQDEVDISTVSMYEVYQQNQDAEKLYTLSQTIVVQSNDVAKVKKASENISEIINKGVIFSARGIEYYYSGLPEARISLLSNAIEDAKMRANEIAKNSGKKVGSIKSASSGIVQVQSLNSTEISDYGVYDTSQIEKQVTVTVRAVFTLK